MDSRVPTKRERGMNQRFSFCLRKEPGKGDYLLKRVKFCRITLLENWKLFWVFTIGV